VDEIGVFTMTGHGLVPVPNPSALFLAARAAGISGSAVTALMEGTRPVLVEVQALAAVSGFGTPQRVATGLEQKRLAVLLAVLERRGSTSFANLDVFVQVTGGLRLTEPASDLAVAAALVSSVLNRPSPPDALFLGELGLGGEIRPIGGVERRLVEASRLGFRRAFVSGRTAGSVPGLTLIGLEHVDELVRAFAA
jgi:DNA repair protein RadA/Sms